MPLRIKKNVACNEGHFTGLDTLINTNGIYYYVSGVRNKYNGFKIIQEKDTSYSSFMFWNDGTVVYLGRNPYTIQSYFDEILAKLEKGKRDKNFYDNLWGNYWIVGDTVRIQYVYVPYFLSLNDFWGREENYFKIIDKNTLKFLPKIGKSLEATAVFLQVERIPPPNCYIKKRRWFWCNKDDWKEYKRQIKK